MQSKNKNDGVQLSTRYEQYCFAKLYFRGTRRPQVFPFTESSQVNNGEAPQGNDLAYCLQAGGDKHRGSYIKQLNQPTHSNDRVYGTDGLSPTLNTMQGGNRQPFIPEDSRIRRLTPTECERLQGFPDVEKSVTIEVCTENLNNLVNAVNQNPKLQKLVGNVEENSSQESVPSAIRASLIKNQQINKHVQPNVLIICEENGIEIYSQEKLLLRAKGVEKKNWSAQHIKIEDFVQVSAGINTIVEKIIRLGEGELHQSEQCLILQKNGKKHVKLFGKEIMQLVEDVKNGSATLKKPLKYTTSDHSDTRSLEQELITLFSSVILATTGFIPKEILSLPIFTIEIKTKLGWTNVDGMSDSQRYKQCGNAVTVNVIRDIITKLL